MVLREENELTMDVRDYELEKNLVEAKRLVVQMRSISLEMSSEGSPPINRTVPDTIDMIDNQTECSSIGIGHAIENLKKSPTSDSAIENEAKRDVVATLSFEEKFSDSKKEEKSKFQARQDARAAKRNIEDLLKKSKMTFGSNRAIQYTINEEIELTHEPTFDSSTSNKDEIEFNHQPMFDCSTSNREEYQKSYTSSSDDMAEYSDSFVREEMKIDDNLMKYSPTGLRKLKNIPYSNISSSRLVKNVAIVSPVGSSTKSSPCTSPKHQKDTDDVLRAAEEVERAIRALGESSRSLRENLRSRSFSGNLQQQEIDLFNVSDSLFNYNFTEVKSNASHEDIEATPSIKSSWETSESFNPNDDDCTSIADYCQFNKKHVETKTPTRKKDNSNIKWEKVSMASSDDSDYVPMQDYSSPSPKRNIRAELFEDKKSSKLSTYRVALKRKRKARRRRIALTAICVVFIALATTLHYHKTNFSLIRSEFIDAMNRAASFIWNGTHLSNEVNTTQVNTNRGINVVMGNTYSHKQQHQMIPFYSTDHHICSKECLLYFHTDEESDNLIVPIECFGISTEDSESHSLAMAENVSSIERRHFCNLPILANILPHCRQSISPRNYELSSDDTSIEPMSSVEQSGFCNIPFSNILPLCRRRSRKNNVNIIFTPSQYYTEYKL